MQATAPHGAVLIASGNSVSKIELVLLVVAAAIVVILLTIKAVRSHGKKMRKAASEGYFDRDVARYAPGTVGTSLVEKSFTTGPLALSPSFVSSKPARSKKSGPRPAPGAAGPTFVEDDRSTSSEVRAFDPTEAIEQRPAPAAVPSLLEWDPPPAGESVTPGEDQPVPPPPPQPQPQPQPPAATLPALAVPEQPAPPTEPASPPLPPLVQPPPPAKSPPATSPPAGPSARERESG